MNRSPSVAVVNASPLIVLCKSNLEEILPRLFNEVLVPEDVWREVVAGADATSNRLPQLAWARRVQVTDTHSTITSWDLGAGEASVLNLAFDTPPARAMVDDKAARACA